MELLSFICLLAILPIVALISKFVLHPRRHSDDRPPGPRSLPIIGNIHQLLGDLPHHALRRLATTHGPLMRLRLGQVDYVVASSPEVASDILKNNDLSFASRPELVALSIVFYRGSDILTAPYGQYWRNIRKFAVLKLFSTNRVKSFQSQREEEIRRLVTEIHDAAVATSSRSTLVNLRSKITTLINMIVARSTFGKRCEHSERFIAGLNVLTKLASGFCVADLFPNVKYVDVVTGLRFKAGWIQRQNDVILGRIIEEHRMRGSNKKDDEAEEQEDLVDVLLRIKESGESEVPLTDNNIKAVLVSIFAGGTETSSVLIEWAMAELMKNPGCMHKAQSEARRVLKGKTRVESQDIEELHYLKLVIKETLRLHPPLPLLVPRLCINTSQVHGYTIDAGTRVIVNAWAIARDPRYWNDPEIFDPERFDGSTIDFKGLDFEFLPFGSGRRVCPGITFGMSSVELALAHLLFYLNWELPRGMKPEDLDMSEDHGITATLKSELCLVATPYLP